MWDDSRDRDFSADRPRTRKRTASQVKEVADALDAKSEKIKSMMPGLVYDIDGVKAKWCGLIHKLEPGQRMKKSDGKIWTNNNPESAMWRVSKELWRFIFVKPNGYYVMATEMALDRIHPQDKPKKVKRRR